MSNSIEVISQNDDTILSGDALLETISHVTDLMSCLSSAVMTGHIMSDTDIDISDSYETMLGKVIDTSGPERVVVDVIRDTIYNIDVSVGVPQHMSGMLMSGILTDVFESLTFDDNVQRVLTPIVHAVDDIRTYVTSTSRRATLDELRGVYQYVSNDDIANMLIDAITLGGAGARVVIDNSSMMKRPTVTLETGYTFKHVVPVMSVVGSTSNSVTLDDVKVVCIDGFVDSMSSVDHIFRYSYEESTPIVMIARQFDDDVIHTAAVNYKRGTAKVIPIVARFDVNSANTLKDIAVVTGCHVVTSLLGQLITSLNIHDEPIVRRVTITHDGVTIHDDSRSEDVTVYVMKLRERLEHDTKDNAGPAKDVLTERIRSLSNRTVAVNVDKNDIMFPKIDRAIRLGRCCIIHGVIDLQRLHTYVNKLSSCSTNSNTIVYNGISEFVSRMLRDGQIVFPTSALMTMLTLSIANVRLLATTGTIVCDH